MNLGNQLLWRGYILKVTGKVTTENVPMTKKMKTKQGTQDPIKD